MDVNVTRWLVALVVASAAGGVARADGGALRRVARSARRDISTYRAYRDVTVLPYAVPERARLAVFSFTATEEIRTGLGSCSPRNVTVDLRPGSFPVVSPDGALFPDDFAPVLSGPWYAGTALSDGRAFAVNVTYPLAGDWYVIAYVSYTDPDDDKITQQGLTASCITFLESTLDVLQAPADDIAVLSIGQPLPQQVEAAVGQPLLKEYSVYVPAATWEVTVNVTVERCQSGCPSITVLVRAGGLPTSEDTGDNSTLTKTCDNEDIVSAEDCILSFAPWEESWHYVALVLDLPEKSSKRNVSAVTFSVDVSTVQTAISPFFLLLNTSDVAAPAGNASATPTALAVGEAARCDECWPQVALMKQSYPPFFMLNYVLVPGADGKSPPALNVTTAGPTVLGFTLRPVSEVGGTLTVQLQLQLDAQLRNATARGTGFNVTVVACVTHGTRAQPLAGDLCVAPGFSSGIQAPLAVNSTSSKAAAAKVHIPFPAPGAWYLSLQPLCWAQANGSVSFLQCTGLTQVAVSFVIDSEACGPDMCGEYGRCNNYLSGGVIFSSCACVHGYRGWGCTDASAMTSTSELLVAALLLTLSNLFFAPAVVVACRHRYWTEALVYTATMFFSTFYHACEAGEDVYSWCMMPLGVLQFCDFYTAILAVWVTLVAMADVHPTFRSLCHVAGAIGIALGTEYDRTSLAVFMFPVLVGVAILGASWGSRCRRRRRCYPTASYWRWRAPPGLALVLVGVVCYAFLQTRQNYKYVHSAWHAVMALAVVFLLPRKPGIQSAALRVDDTPDEEATPTDRRPFWKKSVRGWRKRSM
ncbi:post-GPI attachment to proteins factor 6 [Schistocerca piceifrons]|uniref:post-GPI attachment to proteins factor 6 n=1 Tax=Schistocerca piceifrons TaxID=274613 RepID=UPI001F5F630F|nr:post-GPI attachment to proteins factor 6 [Schistocerca piceifrons]